MQKIFLVFVMLVGVVACEAKVETLVKKNLACPSGGSQSNCQATVVDPINQPQPSIDPQKPVASVVTHLTSPTNVGAIPFTVTFSKEVENFTAERIVVTGGTIKNFTGSGMTYTFEVTPTADGNISVTIPANAAYTKDKQANGASSPLNIVYDTVPPTAAITAAPSQNATTTDSAIQFRIAFSEPIQVSTFVTTALSNIGTAAISAWTITDTGDHQNFLLVARAGANSGTVIPSLAVGTVKDLAGNVAAAVTTSQDTIQFQLTVSQITSFFLRDSNASVSSPWASISASANKDVAWALSGSTPSTLRLDPGNLNLIPSLNASYYAVNPFPSLPNTLRPDSYYKLSAYNNDFGSKLLNYDMAMGFGSSSSSSMLVKIVPFPDGSYVVAGSFSGTVDFDPGPGTANLTSPGTTNGFVAKYSSSDAYQWAFVIGDEVYDVSALSDGSILAAGRFTGTWDFDPSAGTANLTNPGLGGAYVAKYDASGAFVWAKGTEGSGGASSRSLSALPDGSFVLVGYFSGTVDLDPSSATANVVDAGSGDAFVARYDALGNYLWGMRLGGTGADQAEKVALLPDASVIVMGDFAGTVDFDPGAGTANLTAAGSSDIFMAKYSASGALLWRKSIGGAGSSSGIGSFAVGADGSIYLVGSFNASIDVDPGAGSVVLTPTSNDFFVAKYTSAGDYVWSKAFVSASGAVANDVVLLPDENLIVTGSFAGTMDFDPGVGTANLTANAGNKDIFLLELTNQGDYVLAHAMGGSGFDMGIGAALATDGSVFIGGFFQNTADFDPGPGTANLSTSGFYSFGFVARYVSPNVKYTPAKISGLGMASIVGSGTGAKYVHAIKSTPDGNIVAVGFYEGTVAFDPNSSAGNRTANNARDIFIAKYKANGQFLWVNAMGGFMYDEALAIDVARDGAIYTCGYIQGTVDFDPGAGTANLTGTTFDTPFFAKYDKDGNYVWAKTLTTGSGSCRGLALTKDDAIIISGYFSSLDFDPGAGTVTLTAAGGNDGFLAKYDTNGNYVWAKAIGGSGFDRLDAIAVNGSGEIYAVGSFDAQADFDPGAGTANLTPLGGYDAFMAKYDASGNYIWAKSFGGTGNEGINSVAVLSDGSIAVGGYFSGTVDFDPGAGTANLMAAGTTDAFVGRYSKDGNYLWVKGFGGAIGNDSVYRLAIAPGDDIFLTGIFNDTITLGSGATTVSLSSAGNYDGFAIKYAKDGTLRWAKRAGSSTTDYFTAATVLPDGSAIAAGVITGASVFGEDESNETSLSAASIGDFFLWRLFDYPHP